MSSNGWDAFGDLIKSAPDRRTKLELIELCRVGRLATRVSVDTPAGTKHAWVPLRQLPMSGEEEQE